ncbi:MAG TPA: CoA-binding protein [Chthonomonadaceae bacterium]|nr:CoA-binding protein [Chthonomonadaceae bacterium]
MSTRALIEQILEQRNFAVAGASRDPDKYGYKVYKTLKEAGYNVYAVNPNADTIDGDPCYPSLDNIPGPIDCLVTVTPPEITEEIIRTAGHLKVPYLWMQPGSESMPAFNLARSYSMQIVSGGPCIMVAVAQRRARDVAA